MATKLKNDSGFKKAAIYKIVVQGELDKSWSDNILGMQVKVDRREDKTAFTSIVGEIRDQTALSSVLNTLYQMHMTVISVSMLTDAEGV